MQHVQRPGHAERVKFVLDTELGASFTYTKEAESIEFSGDYTFLVPSRNKWATKVPNDTTKDLTDLKRYTNSCPMAANETFPEI